MNRTKNARKAVHDSIHAIHDDSLGVAADVRDLGEAVKDVLIEKLGDMLKRAVSFGERGKEAAQEAVEDVRDQLESRIRTHPYQTILIAGGAGLVLGLWLRRR